MKYTAEILKSWLDALEEQPRKLTKWELDFTASLREQFDRKGWLSDRQIEILERIYAEKT